VNETYESRIGDNEIVGEMGTIEGEDSYILSQGAEWEVVKGDEKRHNQFKYTTRTTYTAGKPEQPGTVVHYRRLRENPEPQGKSFIPARSNVYLPDCILC
jgi:hypothetical protein